MDRHASIPRCVLVWFTVTACVAGLVPWLSGDVIRTAGLISSHRLAGAPFDELLAQLAAVAVVGCALWFWPVTTLITVEAALGATDQPSRLPLAGCPEGIRRLLLAACGLVLVSGLATPATAGAGRVPARSPGAAVLVGLPLPERATTQAATTPGSVHSAGGIGQPLRTQGRRSLGAPAPARALRVRVGDTLWSLTASMLSPGASADVIADSWRAVYAHNKAVIGDDPDLIMPGTILSIPDIWKEPR